MFEEYIVYSLHLMKNILSCELYQSPQPDGQLQRSGGNQSATFIYTPLPTSVTPLPQVLEAQGVRARFFEQPGVLQEVLRQLVTEYMLLSDDELSMWQDRPEEFGASLCEPSLSLSSTS